MFLDSPQNIPTNNKVRGSMVVVYNIALLLFFLQLAENKPL